MRSPWLIQTGCLSPMPQVASNNRLVGLDLDVGAAEFAGVPALDLAAELGRHGHLAIADAEHGNAGIEDRLRRARRAFLVDRFRAAGEDHRLRLHLRERGFRLLERHDLGIDALLAHPARDQLRHLAAEIDDQNLVMRRGHEGVGSLIGWAAVMASNYATQGRVATPEDPAHQPSLRAKRSNPRFFAPENGLLRRKCSLAQTLRVCRRQ